MTDRILKQLTAISTEPERGTEAYDAWLDQADAFSFLAGNLKNKHIVIYAALPFTFIHAVPVPSKAVDPVDVDDLLSWSCNPYDLTWGITHAFSGDPPVYLSPPLNHSGSKSLADGEPLIIARSFEGDTTRGPYFEANQRFVHVSDLHYVRERNAYCRLDKHGDLEDAILIKRIAGTRLGESTTVVTFDRQLLDQYMALADLTLVRMFDFTRQKFGQVVDWNKNPEEILDKGDGIVCRFNKIDGVASFTRGFQIISAKVTREQISKKFHAPSEHEPREYASFIAHDWKNSRIEEISCAPTALANYFTRSELPYEITPAFFRPEVLSKYKADHEKYELQSRSISCRGTWHLPTYDINTAGQVHTYLVYLSKLPYEEQLHWKQFNEAPKAPISDRAYKTDMLGEWSEEYDSLASLKAKLIAISNRETEWWSLRSEDGLTRVQYPVTASTDEWKEELLSLDQLLVEGFREKWLRNKAGDLGRTPDVKYGSIKLIEECLLGLGFEEDRASSIVAPFKETRNLRSKLKGHAPGKTAKSLASQALTDHGSYRVHFEDLCARCDESLEIVMKALEIRETN